MAATRPFWPQLGRMTLWGVWLLGFFLVIDSVLIFSGLLLLMLLGRQFSPYAGLAVFLVIPILGLFGAAVCWISYGLLRAGESGGRTFDGSV